MYDGHTFIRYDILDRAFLQNVLERCFIIMLLSFFLLPKPILIN